MDARLSQVPPTRKSETAAHLELKRLALLWAQENGYPIVALEVSLPQCRYRADVAAYRPQRNGMLGHTVVFECKQSTPDLRRDDCRGQKTLARLESVYRRRQILEKHLRIHYPTLRTGETLFPEWTATTRRDRASRLSARHARAGCVAGATARRPQI